MRDLCKLTLSEPITMTEVEVSKRPGSPSVEGESKKAKLEDNHAKRGVAHVKKEYIIDAKPVAAFNDDDAEASGERDSGESKGRGKKRGQNKNREIKQLHEENKLCPTLIDPESGKVCPFGPEKCKFSHNVDEYLAKKGEDIPGVCPVFNALGRCPVGLKCRFLHSHLTEDKKLVKDEEKIARAAKDNYEINHISNDDKILLIKKKFIFERADAVNKIMDDIQNDNRKKDEAKKKANQEAAEDKATENNEETAQEATKDAYSQYMESRFFASEKKKLDLVGKKILSPLTTVGNLPYRRLMKTLGTDITYSEMAFSLPVIQGAKSEWALPKAHSSEYPGFGVQIAGSKHWQCAKATEAITKLCPNISSIDLNSGCPVDLLYRQGSGSALLDQPARLLRILNSMNYCSGEVPTTVKIRMGTKDNHPVAHNLVKRIVKETQTAAITLHGRSRQQRYTKEANWDYIAEVGQIIRETEAELEEDKNREDFQRVNFVGNGDCFNWDDWHRAVENPYIDSVMIGRGALIKPWIFEEIDAKQYLDKSATERLEMIKTYANFALEHWGSDEYGIAQSRRFLCEFLSFFHRYTPYGILERYPIKLNERPENWKGRNELETLLGSGDYKDWIKISEMFLGPVGDNFKFTPKHKSNSYES